MSTRRHTTVLELHFNSPVGVTYSEKRWSHYYFCKTSKSNLWLHEWILLWLQCCENQLGIGCNLIKWTLACTQNNFRDKFNLSDMFFLLYYLLTTTVTLGLTIDSDCSVYISQSDYFMHRNIYKHILSLAKRNVPTISVLHRQRITLFLEVHVVMQSRQNMPDQATTQEQHWIRIILDHNIYFVKLFLEFNYRIVSR